MVQWMQVAVKAVEQEELGPIKGNQLGGPGAEASSGRNKKAGMGLASKRSDGQPKGTSGSVVQRLNLMLKIWFIAPECPQMLINPPELINCPLPTSQVGVSSVRSEQTLAINSQTSFDGSEALGVSLAHPSPKTALITQCCDCLLLVFTLQILQVQQPVYCGQVNIK